MRVHGRKGTRIASALLAATVLAGTVVRPAPAEAYDMGKVGQGNTISACLNQTAAIQSDGSLWTWGNNYHGQLGNGTTENSSVPVKVLDNVAAVSCGDSCTAAIKSDGSLWTWGYNFYGQLGNGTTKDSFVPVKMLDNVVAVGCGYAHTAAIQSDGSLWMWGSSGASGAFGNGTTGYSSVPIKVMDNVVAVSCGSCYTAAIQNDGSLWMWGCNNYGELGNGTTEDMFVPTPPTKVMDNVVAVSCGSRHTAAIQSDGSLWTWGYNGVLGGLLGDGTSKNSSVPVKVLDNVTAVSCGFYHTAAIQTDGSLWTWGGNTFGRLGDGTKKDSSVPIKIMDNVTAVSCERNHTAALKADGSLWTWGLNDDGQLGNGTTEGSSVPIKIMDNVALPGSIAIQPTGGEPSQPAPAPNTAYASTQTVQVDGKPVEFQCYALKDADGNDTNYIKLRDLAALLNGTSAQFEIGWDGAVSITTQTPYTPNGSELSTPFSGDRSYEEVSAATKVNGAEVELAAFRLSDDNGGGYTYYKLRDLGQSIGFNVGWSPERGLFVETDQPYDPAN